MKVVRSLHQGSTTRDAVGGAEMYLSLMDGYLKQVMADGSPALFTTHYYRLIIMNIAVC